MRNWNLRRRSILVLAAFLFGMAGLTTIVQATFTTLISININYAPVMPDEPAGSVVEQVFRPNAAPAVASAAPLGTRNPKTDAGAGAPVFMQGNAAAIGNDDYVYAFQLTVGNVTEPVNLFAVSLCTTRITSVGYYPVTNGINPSLLTPFPGVEFDFSFNSPTIDQGQFTAILFYTSPDPPARRNSTIKNLSALSTNGSIRSYGACSMGITVKKEVSCDGVTWKPSTNAVPGAQVFFRITVTNTGPNVADNVLRNIVITDTQLAAGTGDITSQFTFPVTPGQLAFGQFVQKVFGPLTVTNGSPPPSPGTLVGTGINPAGVTSEYSILNSDGTPSGQTITLAPVFSPAPITPDQAPVTVLTPGIVSAKTVSPLMFISFPVTLNYTLKGTNTGETDLQVDLRDAKLKTMIAAPPPGIVFNSVTVQTGAGFAAGAPDMDLANDIVASFPTVNKAGGASPMAQVNVSLTVQSLAAFAALADGLNIPQSYKATNIMTAQGFPQVIDACVGGAVGGGGAVMHQSSAVTMYQPPCLISLKKEVSCGPVN
ncbi:MAG: hypothetical protein ACKV2V_10415, partial [Blastocatellia bacterium]